MPLLEPPGPPGFDIAPPSPAPTRLAAEARRPRTNADGKLRYNLDSRGRWEAGDAIDQGVALSLGVTRGNIRSAPQVGNDIHLVTPGQPSTQAAVEDAIRRSYPLSDYLARGLVETIRIRSESRPNGGIAAEYTYRKPGSDQNQTAFFPPR